MFTVSKGIRQSSEIQQTQNFTPRYLNIFKKQQYIVTCAVRSVRDKMVSGGQEEEIPGAHGQVRLYRGDGRYLA